MAITVFFNPAAPMAAADYDEVMRRLDHAGCTFAGLLSHTCYGPDDNLRVVDVWSSREQFDAFAPMLLPILQQVGIDPGQPQFVEVHNFMTGEVPAAANS